MHEIQDNILVISRDLSVWPYMVELYPVGIRPFHVYRYLYICIQVPVQYLTGTFVISHTPYLVCVTVVKHNI